MESPIGRGSSLEKIVSWTTGRQTRVETDHTKAIEMQKELEAKNAEIAAK